MDRTQELITRQFSDTFLMLDGANNDMIIDK